MFLMNTFATKVCKIYKAPYLRKNDLMHRKTKIKSMKITDVNVGLLFKIGSNYIIHVTTLSVDVSG